MFLKFAKTKVLSIKVNCPAENVVKNKRPKKSVSAKKHVKRLKAFGHKLSQKAKVFVYPKQFCKRKNSYNIHFSEKAGKKIENSWRVNSIYYGLEIHRFKQPLTESHLRVL